MFYNVCLINFCGSTTEGRCVVPAQEYKEKSSMQSAIEETIAAFQILITAEMDLSTIFFKYALAYI